MSNRIRDGLMPLLVSLAKMCDPVRDDSMVDTETPRMVPGLPNIRPFDISIPFDQVLGDSPAGGLL